MVSLKQLLALAAYATASFAQAAVADAAGEVPDVEAAEPAQAAALKVEVSTFFPDAEIFGVKLVNGRPTRALYTVTNNEAEPITVLVGTGSILTPVGVVGAPDPPEVVRNLTTTKYSTTIPPNSAETITYSFSTIMNPQDVTLDLKLLVQARTSIYTVGVFREGVSVVEAPVSIFDPQIIFLYLVLAGAFGGTIYAIYAVWIKDLLPQKKRRAGDRSKRAPGSKKADTDEGVSTGADVAAAATSSKGYDESWIPVEHLNRPSAKKVGGRPKSRAA